MNGNDWLMIVLAFILGYMASGMMKNMCGGRLVEGIVTSNNTVNTPWGSIPCAGGTINGNKHFQWLSQSKEECKLSTTDQNVMECKDKARGVDFKARCDKGWYWNGCMGQVGGICGCRDPPP